MAKKTNSRTIGLCVLGAIALLLSAIVVFGSGRFLQERPRAVIFFEGSVAGLTVGAPITLRGVTIGSVTDILLQIDPRTGLARIPVFVEFQPERVSMLGEPPDGKSLGNVMIERGLRAALVNQSFVTGQLAVELDYYPDSEVTLVGMDMGVPEIPAVRSGLDAVREAITNLPLQELTQTALNSLNNLDRILGAPELPELLAGAARTVKAAGDITELLRAEASPIVGDLRQTTESSRQVAEEATKVLVSLNGLITDIDQQLLPLASDLRTTVRTADRTLTQGEATLSSLNSLVAPRSPTRQDLDTTMRNLADASRSLRSFAQQLERNPNSILLGR